MSNKTAGKQEVGPVRAALLEGLNRENWSQWVELNTGRLPAFDTRGWGPGKTLHPLKWASVETSGDNQDDGLLKRLVQVARRRKPSGVGNRDIEQWLHGATDDPPSERRALEAVAWAHALPTLIARLDARPGVALVDALLALVERAESMSVTQHAVSEQLLAGELAWTLAAQFPELPRCAQQEVAAAARVSHGLVELLDGEGLPHARHLDDMRVLLACWTRCLYLEMDLGTERITSEAHEQYAWLVRQAIRWARPDGTQLLAQGIRGDWRHDLFRAALAIAGDSVDQTIAARILPATKRPAKPVKKRKLPEPSVYSEWADVAVLRSKWTRKSPVLASVFDEGTCRTELVTGGRAVWRGSSLLEVAVDGQTLQPSSPWRELCWYADDDVVYLELEVDLDQDWQVQRQWMLARQDHLLLMADAVLGPVEADLAYRNTWPLESDIQFVPESLTWEGYLMASRPLATVLPLALPEWRTESIRGSLRCDQHRLELRQTAQARRLYAPLLFDLQTRRATAKRTWRQLTVAEKLVRQPADVAVGYRVQLGRKQWLIYRSLTPPANRSLLGQNLSQEFIAARFDLDGTIDELIEVE